MDNGSEAEVCYRVPDGRVLDVSPDAITRDRRDEGSHDASSGIDKSASEPKGQSQSMRHASHSTAPMEIDGKSIPLGPGMAVTVGLKIGGAQ
jgi:hemolysin D